MDKVNLLRDAPETTIERLDEERFQLDRLKDAFNNTFKEYDELLLTEKDQRLLCTSSWMNWMNVEELVECKEERNLSLWSFLGTAEKNGKINIL